MKKEIARLKKKTSIPKGKTAATEKKVSTGRRRSLQQILHQMREEVIVDIEKQLGRELNPGVASKVDTAMDTGDWAALELSEGINYKLLEMRYRRFKEIADAFRRLESGTTGVCENCGGKIPLKRLKAEPFARYCVPCLTEIEAFEEIKKEETRPPAL